MVNKITITKSEVFMRAMLAFLGALILDMGWYWDISHDITLYWWMFSFKAVLMLAGVLCLFMAGFWYPDGEVSD